MPDRRFLLVFVAILVALALALIAFALR